jgi:hypothetical protein
MLRAIYISVTGAQQYQDYATDIRHAIDLSSLVYYSDSVRIPLLCWRVVIAVPIQNTGMSLCSTVNHLKFNPLKANDLHKLLVIST